MKYNPFLDVLGQSLASVLSDDRMDSISTSLSAHAGKRPRVRKFHPDREVLPASARTRFERASGTFMETRTWNRLVSGGTFE